MLSNERSAELPEGAADVAFLSSIMFTMFLVDSNEASVTAFCCLLNLSKSLSAMMGNFPPLSCQYVDQCFDGVSDSQLRIYDTGS